MADVEGIEDRDALYYPFIHIRNEAWLRSALLFFPHVLRMTPPGFDLDDTPFVRELAATKGRRGEPLVGAYPLDSGFAYMAGERLAVRFAADIDTLAFRKKYGRAAVVAVYGDDSVFQIHKDKFAGPLTETLRKVKLVWAPSRPNRGAWFAVHPVIGEIIMSTAAVAAARDRGCDVLTDTERNHRVIATRDEDTIYATLLGRMDETAEGRLEARELGDLVVATTFDLSTLTADDFAALSREREALFDFRRVLAQRAAEIPAVGDHEARLARAQEAAEQIVAEWEATRRTWGRFMKRATGLEAAGEAKGAATELLKAVFPAVIGAGAGAAATAATAAATAGGAATAATTVGAATAGGLAAAAGGALLGAAPGLAVGFVYYSVKTWRDLGVEERDAPTRFLSHVAARGGVLAAASASAPRS